MDLESIYRRTVFSWRDQRDSEMDNINFFSFYVFTVKAKYNLIIRPWISTQCGTTLSLECINRNVLLVDKWGHLYAGLCSHLHQSPLSGEQAFCWGRWGWRTQTTSPVRHAGPWANAKGSAPFRQHRRTQRARRDLTTGFLPGGLSGAQWEAAVCSFIENKTRRNRFEVKPAEGINCRYQKELPESEGQDYNPYCYW